MGSLAGIEAMWKAGAIVAHFQACGIAFDIKSNFHFSLRVFDGIADAFADEQGQCRGFLHGKQ